MGFIGAGINFAATQRTNETNRALTRETNLMNRDIAREQNELNYKMFTEQNDWNYNMWQKQNEYNDPSAQVERYLKAGINPLWAISNGNPGNAQQLSSAPWAGAAGATMVPPQMQAPHVDLDEVAALQSVINGYQGFQRLSLEKKANKAAVAKTEAETDLIKSQTISQDFLNSINLDTYDAQVGSIVQRYTNLIKEGNLTDAEVEKSKALKDQAIAATSKTQAETFDILDGINRQWTALSIQQQQADASTMQARAANTQASAAMWNARTNDAALSHQIEKDAKEFELKSNEQILSILDQNRSWLDKSIGNPGNIGEEIFGGAGERFKRSLNTIKAGAKALYNRFYNNPTQANFEAVQSMQKLIKDSYGNIQLPAPFQPLDGTSSSASVLNPWNSWQQ